MKSIIKGFCVASVCAAALGLAAGGAQAQMPGGPYVGGGLGWGWTDGNDDLSWKGLAGWQFNEYASGQVFYAELGEHGAPGFLGDADIDTYGAELLLSFPVAPDLSLYGKGGVHRYKINTRNTSWLAGAGAELGLQDNWSLRGEWTHYDLDPIDSDDFTVQIVYGF
ncbi:MAG: outer membrane beta-barrel protein [Parvibaculum sp.]